MFEEQGPDDMRSEYPSCIEEAFFSSLEGSFFKREMGKARDDKRIGLPLPFDPSRPVNTLLGHRHGWSPPDRSTGTSVRIYRKHRLERDANTFCQRLLTAF
jgi:hypothetical protein